MFSKERSYNYEEVEMIILLNELCSKIKYSLNDISFICTHRSKDTYFSRSTCVLSFKLLIAFILYLPKSALQIELNHFFSEFIPKIKASRAASFQKARKKVHISAFTDLIEQSLETIYSAPYRNFRGYRIVAVDGSVFEIPSLSRKYYGDLVTPGASVAKAQVCMLCDVENNIVLEADIAPYKVNERDQAAQLITLLEQKSQSQDIENLYLLDRGFPSRELIRILEGHPFIFRVSTQFLSPINQAKKTDQVVTIKDDKAVQHQIRVINLQLPTGETEKLISNIIDEEYSVKDFQELYNKRWGIECRYKVLKNLLEIDKFSGIDPEIIEQDFYATILLANLISVAQNCADEEIAKENEGKGLKYEYKSNTNVAIAELRPMLIKAIVSKNFFSKVYLMRKLLRKIKQCVVPIRSDRKSTPRKSKFNMKYPFNRRGNR